MSADDKLDRHALRQVLLAGAKAQLEVVPGTVFSPRAFAAKHLDALRANEIEFVKARLDRLPDLVPHVLRQPLALATEGLGPRAGVDFEIDGARSAYLPAYRLHLKGCRPVRDPRLAFISEEVDPATGEIRTSNLPFGTLTAEGVVRELLAFVFCREHGFVSPRTPVAVFAYEDPAVFCLAFDCGRLQRVEQLLVYPERTLEDLVATAVAEQRTDGPLGPSETSPSGIAPDVYAEVKATELAAWHLAGGFRGILNGNIGNEVLSRGSDNRWSVELFDFDSFSLVPTPASPDENEAMRFMARTCLEAVHSCPPLAVVVLGGDDPQPSNASYRTRVLETFEKRSAVFAAYLGHLRAGLAERKWSDALVDRAWQRVREMPAYFELVSDNLIPEHNLVGSYAPDESLYVAQGVAAAPATGASTEIEFYGRRFAVAQDVLAPRPETELLVSACLAALPTDAPTAVLELCTASGCVAATLAAERAHTRLVATDRSSAAVALARSNADRLGVKARVEILEGSLFEPISDGSVFDIVCAACRNAAGTDGLELVRRIVEGARGRLSPGGLLALELEDGMWPKVAPILAGASFADVTVQRDFRGFEKVATARAR